MSSTNRKKLKTIKDKLIEEKQYGFTSGLRLCGSGSYLKNSDREILRKEERQICMLP